MGVDWRREPPPSRRASLQMYSNVTKTYGSGVAPYIWRNLLVKDVFPVNVTVCAVDGLCSSAGVSVAVTPNASISVGPIISGINAKVRVGLASGAKR